MQENGKRHLQRISKKEIQFLSLEYMLTCKEMVASTFIEIAAVLS